MIMERVHGCHTIKRRDDYVHKSHYQDYVQILIEDFHGICGYCGKSFRVISADRQTDHFIPKSYCKACGHTELIDSYENLVNSCRVCNRNKWNDWPTGSIDEYHNCEVGYVDPASDEFDDHLARASDGKIVPLTKVGSYMCERLRFSTRPIEICWLIEKLDGKLKVIDSKIRSLNPCDPELLLMYYKCSSLLRKFTDLVRATKEAV